MSQLVYARWYNCEKLFYSNIENIIILPSLLISYNYYTLVNMGQKNYRIKIRP